MQYLLTESEYEALQEKAEAGKRAPKKEELQKLCTRVADELPAGVEWIGKDKPWGCILTKKTEWYCDDCPAQKVCPHPHKEWSK